MQSWELQNKIDALKKEWDAILLMTDDEFFDEYNSDDREEIIREIAIEIKELEEDEAVAYNVEEQDHLDWILEMREITEYY